MSKEYPLDIENVGDDVYILRSCGHHDVHEFMRQVRADGYDWPMGMPQHLWCRTVPTRKAGYNCIYALCEKGSRGAYPVTYSSEAYNDDTYEALAGIAAPKAEA